MKMDVADPIGKKLMGVAVNDHHPGKAIENGLDLIGIVCPEIPEPVELVKR